MFGEIKIGMTFMEDNLAIYRKIIIINNLSITILSLLNIILRAEIEQKQF